MSSVCLFFRAELSYACCNSFCKLSALKKFIHLYVIFIKHAMFITHALIFAYSHVHMFTCSHVGIFACSRVFFMFITHALKLITHVFMFVTHVLMFVSHVLPFKTLTLCGHFL